MANRSSVAGKRVLTGPKKCRVIGFETGFQESVADLLEPFFSNASDSWHFDAVDSARIEVVTAHIKKPSDRQLRTVCPWQTISNSIGNARQTYQVAAQHFFLFGH